MFYVASGKVYSTRRDEVIGGYPEYAVKLNADGSKELIKVNGFIATKPVQRQVCTIEEIFAQFKGTPVSELSSSKSIASKSTISNTKRV